MQEEAELVSENALMRYIRIFSELSGQLRYAVGKRIMIEMTLIKICRPSMETKNDALLERIRDLEQAAEHLAANALYQIEVDHVKQVVFDAEMVKKLFA